MCPKIMTNIQKRIIRVPYRRCDLWRHSKTITWFARIPPGETFVFWQPVRKCMQSYHDYTRLFASETWHIQCFVKRGRFECKHRSHRLKKTWNCNFKVVNKRGCFLSKMILWRIFIRAELGSKHTSCANIHNSLVSTHLVLVQDITIS